MYHSDIEIDSIVDYLYQIFLEFYLFSALSGIIFAFNKSK